MRTFTDGQPSVAVRCWTNVTCPLAEIRIRITAMRIWSNIAVALLFAVFAGVGGARGQEEDSSPSSSAAPENASSARNTKKAKAENENHQNENDARQNNPRSLSRDDRSALMSVALDDRHIRMGPRRDCSHLVHAIYLRAG